jgi:hypothetical protein
MNVESIEISGFESHKILCHRSINNNNKIAIYFPGFGYSTDAPFFFYFTNILLNNGYDILSTNPRYNEWNEFNTIQNKLDCIYFEGKLIYNYITKNQQYNDYIWIGKSLGTSSIQGFIKETNNNPKHRYIFCTPYDNNKELSDSIKEIENLNMVIWGKNDTYYSKNIEDEFRKGKSSNVLIMDDMDHGLCSTKGIINTLDTMKTIMEECENFIKK